MVGDYRVTHPDWHSHSWLNIKEYEESLLYVLKLLEKEEHWLVEYFAILASMKELENRECETRVVFWFDN